MRMKQGCVPRPAGGGKKKQKLSRPSGGFSAGGLPKTRRSAAPAAIGAVTRGGVARFTRGKDGVMRITHRELVATLSTGVAWSSALGYTQLNPGLPNGINSVTKGFGTWCPSVAQNFEKYDIEYMRFDWVSSMGSNSPGSFYIGVDYDAYDSSPSSAAALMSAQDSMSCRIWEDASLVLSRNNLKEWPWLYTRTTGTPLVSDEKTYDKGTLYFAPVSSVLGTAGDLYVEYTIALSDPQAPTSLSAPSLALPYGGLTSTNGGNASVFGTVLQVPGSNTPAAYVSANSMSLVLPPGTYRGFLQMDGGAGAFTAPTAYPGFSVAGGGAAITNSVGCDFGNAGSEASGGLTFTVSTLAAVTLTVLSAGFITALGHTSSFVVSGIPSGGLGVVPPPKLTRAVISAREDQRAQIALGGPYESMEELERCKSHYLNLQAKMDAQYVNSVQRAEVNACLDSHPCAKYVRSPPPVGGDPHVVGVEGCVVDYHPMNMRELRSPDGSVLGWVNLPPP